MDLSYLLGTEIVTDDPVLSATATATRKCRYTVIEVYPHFVKGMRVTDNGTEMYECFNLGDLITKGCIQGRQEETKHGCRHYWRYEE
jgi:hypothetical protein